jgi:hypothetical protein
VITALATSAIYCGAAVADAPVTGRTTVSNELFEDILLGIYKYAKEKLGCSDLDSMTLEVLPASYSPPARLRAPSGPDAVYEHWNAVFCGKAEGFLIVLWMTPDGGTAYGLGHPFEKPEDAS